MGVLGRESSAKGSSCVSVYNFSTFEFFSMPAGCCFSLLFYLFIFFAQAFYMHVFA